MNTIERRFLEALEASMYGRKVEWTEEISNQEWKALFDLAQIHNVLPMIYEAVYSCPAAAEADPGMMQIYKRQTIQKVMLQTLKTNEFLQLNQSLREAGITPLVVKGMVCRGLYPQPDHRLSGDEDILIPAEQFPKCHAVMEAQGMYCLEPDKDKDAIYEVPYGKQNSPLYIELHKSLFPPESDAYGDFNRYFENVFDRAVEVPAQSVAQGAAWDAEGGQVLTMGYTDHLFYLICHAFKHFLHSGFGLRQVCDIVLFANAYGNEIDWLAVLEQCREIHADQFAAALFKIGSRYLGFDQEKACWPKEWRRISVDEGAMLADLLDGGVYGASDMSRKHSSNITLNAVSAQKQGKRVNSLLRTIFPPLDYMVGQYLYLEKRPYMLPIAWLNRILRYGRELGAVSNNSVADAVKIGNQRIELLKKYGVIK